MIALIMAGGIGTRFWPLSTQENPKQFLNILGEKSMIRQTVDRILPQIKSEDIYVVTNISQASLVRKHLPELPEDNIISEPYGRNTAACIGLAAIILNKKYPAEETMLVLAADHFIGKQTKFLKIIDYCSNFVKEEKKLLTFGIQPHYPATGYGYIESGKEISSDESRRIVIQRDEYPIYNVKQFKEKPDLETAKDFIASGNFAWNSGMFLWRIDSILQAFEEFMPELNFKLGEIKKCLADDPAGIAKIYKDIPSIPIDIGVMEKADNTVVIPVDIDWNDIGSWKTVAEMMDKDENGNFFSAAALSIDSKNNYVLSTQKDKPIAIIGIEDCAIVETTDALLICKKDKAQDVKRIVNILEKRKNAR